MVYRGELLKLRAALLSCIDVMVMEVELVVVVVWVVCGRGGGGREVVEGRAVEVVTGGGSGG